jgi:hypothetical protein
MQNIWVNLFNNSIKNSWIFWEPSRRDARLLKIQINSSTTMYVARYKHFTQFGNEASFAGLVIGMEYYFSTPSKILFELVMTRTSVLENIKMTILFIISNESDQFFWKP